MDDFVARHEWLSTSPDSGFVRVASAQRRDEAGADVLRGLTLTRVGAGSSAPLVLTDRADWFEAVADVFGLRFDDVEPATLDRLWAKLAADHEEWLRTEGQSAGNTSS